MAEDLEDRRPPVILSVAIFVVFAGTVYTSINLPQGLAPVDPVILGVCLYSLLAMTHRGSPATSGFVRLLPWFWCILLGSFLGMAGVGIPAWATSNLIRTVFALLTFVCLWHILIAARLQWYALAGTLAGFTFTCGMLIAQSGGARGQAYFPHANYAGHYCAMAAVVLIAAARRWYLKLLALAGLLIALQTTSSFGAMAMSVAMLTVYVVRALTRNTAILATGLAILAIGGLFLATPQAADLVPEDGTSWSISETISEQRFDRSQSGRLKIWGDALEAFRESPLGVGPDGVRQREVAVLNGFYLEIHSDPLGYLVERGVIGLIGFIGLWATLFAVARKNGVARVLIIGLLVSGLFRETMHYRHMWSLLALGFAVDHLRSRREEAAEDADEPDEPDPVPAPLAPEDRYFPGVAR